MQSLLSEDLKKPATFFNFLVLALFLCLMISGIKIMTGIISTGMETTQKRLMTDISNRGLGIEKRYRNFTRDLSGFAGAGMFNNLAGEVADRPDPLYSEKYFYSLYQDILRKIRIVSGDKTWTSIRLSDDNRFILERGGDNPAFSYSGTGEAMRQPAITAMENGNVFMHSVPVSLHRGRISYLIEAESDIRKFLFREISDIRNLSGGTIWVMDRNAGPILKKSHGHSSVFSGKLNTETRDIFKSWLDSRKNGTLKHPLPENPASSAISFFQPFRLAGKSYAIIFTCRAHDLHKEIRRATLTLTLLFTLFIILLLVTFLRILGQRVKSERSKGEALSLRNHILNSVTQMAIITTDNHGRITVFNTGAEKLTGYSAKEITGKDFLELLHSKPDTCTDIEGLYRQAALLGENHPFAFIHKVGIHLPVTLTINPITAISGKSRGFLNIIKDISETKRAEEEIKKHEAMLDSLINSIPDLIFVKDTKGTYLACNNSFAAFTGLEKSAIPGLSDYDMFTQKLAGFFRDNDRKMLESMAPRRNQEWVTYPDGKKVLLETLKAPYMDTAGEILGIIGIAHDITAQEEARVLLKNAKTEAEKANLAKSQFLARMSHEIRTPMNAISGMCYLALQTDLSTGQKTYLENIHKSSQSLMEIIDDILDFSRIEAGKMELEKIEFRLHDILKNLAAHIRFKAARKGVELLFGIAPRVPELILGDPLRLGQVLLNLMVNAIKFTEKGEVTLYIETLEKNETGVCLKFTIRDTGIGMTKKETEKLFRAFSQADGSTTRKYGGSGLGLSICKGLVEKMGGEIGVESERGKGSAFHFTAEFDISENNREIVPDMDIFPDNISVLVVDDHPFVRRILEETLSSWSFHVTSVPSARKALSQEQSHHLIIADLNMPGTCGHDLFKILDRTGQMQEARRILMAPTPGNGEEAFSSELSKGCDGILFKPFGKLAVAAALEKVFLKEGPKRKKPGKTASKKEEILNPVERKNLKGKKVLLVEDNKINRIVAVKILQLAEMNVQVAHNGVEGVQKALDQTYDLILMDIQMPEMDGLEATRRIRKENKLVPVIAMTAHAMAEDREKSLKAGMNDHITKPVNPQTLFALAEKWISPGHPNTKKIRMQNSEESKNEHPDIPGISVSSGLAMVAGSMELYTRLLEQFLTSYSDYVKQVREAIASRDLEAAERMVHNIKSASGYIGANDLFRTSAKLEQEIRTQKENPDLQKEFYCSLGGVIDSIKSFVERKSAH